MNQGTSATLIQVQIKVQIKVQQAVQPAALKSRPQAWRQQPLPLPLRISSAVAEHKAVPRVIGACWYAALIQNERTATVAA